MTRPPTEGPTEPCATCLAKFKNRFVTYDDPVRLCVECEAPFVPSTSTQRFCCAPCRGRHEVEGFINSIKRRTFTIAEAAKATGLSAATIRKRIRDREVEIFRLDAIRIRRRDAFRLCKRPDLEKCRNRLIQIQPLKPPTEECNFCLSRHLAYPVSGRTPTNPPVIIARSLST